MATATEALLTVTGDDAINALRHVVAEKGPAHVYTPPVPKQTSCVYVWEIDGELKPQCIVGCALHYLGVPLEAMSGDVLNYTSACGLARKLRYDGRYVIHQRAVEIFRAAQIVQDAALPLVNECECDMCTAAPRPPVDVTWGKALADAEGAWANTIGRREVPVAPEE